MINVSKAGSMRSPVIVVGRFAFKFARNARGRDGNLYEAKLYRSVKATQWPNAAESGRSNGLQSNADVAIMRPRTGPLC